MGGERRFYEAPASGKQRSAPAALRNREPIAAVLEDWLPKQGTVLEIASGTGEHAVYFARRFADLRWQPTDVHPDALASIEAWRTADGLPNLENPMRVDVAERDWWIPFEEDLHDADHGGCISPAQSADQDQNFGIHPARRRGISAVLCINMIHISPWGAALGLLEGSSKLLDAGGVLILYGPWLKSDIPTAPSNMAFDQQLRERDPSWGLRHVEDFEAEAAKRGFILQQVRALPANNLMLLFRLQD